MARTARNADLPWSPPAANEPVLTRADSGAEGVLDALLRAQREQWNAAIAWYGAVVEVQQDLWDQWVCHWAGGVPIDA